MFELTETVLVDEGDRATETVTRLREEGFRFAIDDFGAGYCSLSYLQRHPVDLLKIDRTAVEEFGSDPRGNTLARTILQMADSLDLLTVAEGIETTGQLRELRRFGCDLGQGYLLSRPLEADGLARRFGYASAIAGASDADRARPRTVCAREPADRDGVPVQPVDPGWRAGPGARARPPAAAARATRCGCSAPCDGPPPEPFVTPLGDSLPTAANGSIAPLAPDPAATLRTLRVLRDEPFDVIHVHEPLAPGSVDHDRHAARRPDGRHVPRRRALDRATGCWRRCCARLLDRIDQRVVVSKDALELVQRYLGGDDDDYTVLFNGVETAEIRAATPLPRRRARRSSSSAATRSARGSRCCSRRCALLDLDVSCWVAGDGPDTDRLRIEHAGDARIEWLGRITRPTSWPACAAASVVLRARRCTASRSASC